MESNVTEQDRSKELSLQFPRVPKEVVKSLVEEYWEQEKMDELVVFMKDQEPEMSAFLGNFLSAWIAETSEEESFKIRKSILYGAAFVTKAVRSLEDFGHELPSVKGETIKQEQEEIAYLFRLAATTMDQNRIQGQDDEDAISEIKFDESLKPLQDEFFAEGREVYMNENPHLFSWLSSVGVAVVGGELAYKYLRRQYFQDQIKRMFVE